MLRRLLAAGALVLAFSGAHAELVYEWRTSGPGNLGSDAFGRIEFADGVGFGTDIRYRWGTDTMGSEECPGGGRGCKADPDTPIDRFAFAPTEELESVGPFIPQILVDVQPSTGLGFIYFAPENFFANLRITESGALVGLPNANFADLYGNNGVSDVALDYVGGTTWTMTRFSSDAGDLCFLNSPPCSGITGEWTLISAVAKVPAPGSIALLAGGVFVAGLLRRRRGVPPSAKRTDSSASTVPLRSHLASNQPLS